MQRIHAKILSFLIVFILLFGVSVPSTIYAAPEVKQTISIKTGEEKKIKPYEYINSGNKTMKVQATVKLDGWGQNYESATNFSNGQAIVYKGKEAYYINTKGKIISKATNVIKWEYDE